MPSGIILRRLDQLEIRWSCLEISLDQLGGNSKSGILGRVGEDLGDFGGQVIIRGQVRKTFDRTNTLLEIKLLPESEFATSRNDWPGHTLHP